MAADGGLVQVGTIGLLRPSTGSTWAEAWSSRRTRPRRSSARSSATSVTRAGRSGRVPRRLQELRLQIGAATAELTQALGRSPTPRRLAGSIGCTVEEIVEGIESANAYSTLSLDTPDAGDRDAPSMLDALGIRREAWSTSRSASRSSPCWMLWSLGRSASCCSSSSNMTQSQIAAEIGVSQMHVVTAAHPHPGPAAGVPARRGGSSG
ncbi:MAG: sigma-70 domain-containing protein [Nocardioides sp.]